MIGLMIALLLLSTSCVVPNNKHSEDELLSESIIGESDSDKIQLTVLIPPWNGGPLALLYARFNTAARLFYEKHGIEVVLYEEMWDDAFSIYGDIDLQNDYQNKLYADILAGKGPDLIFTKTNLQPLNDIWKKIDTDVFYDLDEFIITDKNFDINDYNNTVLNAGVYKGGRYLFPTAYVAGAWMTTNEKFNEAGLSKEDFATFENYMSTWETLQKSGKYRFDADGMYYSTPLFNYGWLDWCIDYETKTVDFNSPMFKRIVELFRNERMLELHSEVDGNRDDLRNSPITDMVHQEKLFRYIGDTASFAYEYNSDYVICPIPNPYGCNAASVTEYCVIPKTASNPELAWEFIKALIGDESVNENILRISGAPIKNSQLDTVIDFWMNRWDEITDIDYIDEIKHIYRSCDNSVVSNTKSFTIYNSPGFREYIDNLNLSDGDKEFLEMKLMVENYFRIYMSE